MAWLMKMADAWHAPAPAFGDVDGMASTAMLPTAMEWYTTMS